MRRRSKLATALLVIAASLVIVLWNTSANAAPPALGVSEAKRKTFLLEGEPVRVHGNVVEGSILEDGSRVTQFVVADTLEQLLVRYDQTPPDNFGAKEVVVVGQLQLDPQGIPFLQAESIQVGCASKY